MTKDAIVEDFSDLGALRALEANWPAGKNQIAAKIVYDRAAAEIRVQVKTPAGMFEKQFPVEPDLASALAKARAFVAEQ